jgi:hypothetical protein
MFGTSLIGIASWVSAQVPRVILTVMMEVGKEDGNVTWEAQEGSTIPHFPPTKYIQAGFMFVLFMLYMYCKSQKRNKERKKKKR